MKKHLKTCLAILFSIVLAMNSVSVSALALDNDNEQEMSTVDNGENYEEIQSEDCEEVQAIEELNPSTSGDEVGEMEEASLEETGQETTGQEDAEDVITTEEIRTEETAVEETAVETTAVETTSEAITGENEEETTEEMTSEAITEESEATTEETVNMPEFAGLKIVDGVVIMVTAPEGVFPEESTLLVNKVSNEEQQNVDNAVDKTRNNNVNVAASYTYDIKVLNKDGEEIQPADEQKVKVIFTLAEADNENLTADIYHITGENGELSAEALDTIGQGAVVMAESDGFSYYTVEFTYGEKQYVMQGDSAVALTDILSYVGITKADGSAATDSDITAVSVSDESLFSASNESGKWIVTAHQAFTSNEWMKVTVDGVEYEIVVTDDGVPSYLYDWNGKYLSASDMPIGEVVNFSKLRTDYGVVAITWRKTGGGTGFFIYKDGTSIYSSSQNVYFTDYPGSAVFDGKSYKVTQLNEYPYCLYLQTMSAGSISYETTTVSKTPGDAVFTNELTKVGDGAVTYSSNNTSVAMVDESTGEVTICGQGEATITATVSDSNTYIYATKTASYTVTVDKPTISPTVTMEGWTYGDTEKNPSVSGNTDNGTVTYTYQVNKTGEWVSTKPTTAGTHTVKVSIAETANYNGGTATADFTVAQKEVGLEWANTSFTYDGDSHAPTVTAMGLVGSDTCTVTVTGGQKNAGNYTATASELSNSNYKLPTENTKPFTISKKAATITANDQTVTYGTSIASTVDQVVTEGLVTGDTLTAITLTPSTSDVTTDGTITPSAAVIKKGDTDVTNNYDITFNTGNLKINKKPITISGIKASNKTYDGTTAATLKYNEINWVDCGKVGDDDLSVTATGAFSDAGIGTGKTVTISDLTLSGAKAGNYELASSGQQTDTTANITAKSITITADSDSKVYDGTAHTKNSYSVTSGVLADGDTIESVTVTGSQKYVGLSDNIPSAAVIKNSSGVDVTSNYNITYTNGTLTVTKKPLTITADSDTKVYDTTPLTKNSYTYTELAAGDTIESVTVTGTQTAVGESANVPSAAVIKNGDDDVTANYDITYVNGTLKVTKKVVTITANSDTKTYDGTALTNDGYTVSGLEAGDRVDIVTITGTQTKAGTSNNVPSEAIIKNSANEVVNDNYTISYVNGTLEVTKKAVTITADSDTKEYDGTALTKDSYTNSELAAGDTIENVTVTGSQISAGEGANVPGAAVIKNASNEDVTTSYDITYINGTLEVTPKAITITADDATKVYDGTALTKDSYTNSDLVAGDSIESVTITGIQTDAGESANVPSEAVIKNVNGEDVTASYDITYENGTLEVNKKQVTISGITATDKTYDGATDAELDYSDIDWTVCGMVDGDELSVTAKGTYEDTSVGEDKSVIITDITIGGTSVDNYILAEDGHQTRANAKITKKSVTVTALKQTVAVNGEIENSVDMAELTGAVEGHKLAEITLTSGSTENTTTEGVITPGMAKIVDGDIDVTDNYDITYADGVMTVTKAEAEVVLDNGDDEAPASVTAVEVPNLLELADEEAEEGKLVKVELSVKPVSESNVNSTTASDVKKTVESLFAFVDKESVKVEYLEIDLTKYIDNVKDGAISDTGTPLEIILTYDTSKAGNPVIIRSHEGTVKVFTQLSARPAGSLTDATYYVEGNKIYMYSQYFSDFAIAYSVEKTFNVNLDDGNGNIIRQIVSEGAKFIPPADLTKDGYDFGGWYKDEAFTQKWNPDTDKVTSDIMLYAKWEKHKEEIPTKTEAPATTEETAETPTTEVPTTKVDTPKAATTPSNTAKSPATGDTSQTDIVFFLMILAVLGMICLRFIRKKNSR